MAPWTRVAAASGMDVATAGETESGRRGRSGAAPAPSLGAAGPTPTRRSRGPPGCPGPSALAPSPPSAFTPSPPPPE